jgi:ATP-dependent DNA helicase RecQ
VVGGDIVSVRALTPLAVGDQLARSVSPLIALMADQVSALQQSGVAAEKLDSNTGLDARSDIWRRIDEGKLESTRPTA